jgi:integrase
VENGRPRSLLEYVAYPSGTASNRTEEGFASIAKQAGLEESFSTHSPRGGGATALYSLGVEESAISRHLRHKSATTTRVCDRPSNQLEHDPFRSKL